MSKVRQGSRLQLLSISIP